MPERRKITTAEWVALANWYREKTGQELPQRLLGGYIREDDPIYQEFVAGGKVGYTPPRYSAAWYAMTDKTGIVRKPSWLPVTQGAEPPPSPVTPTTEEDEWVADTPGVTQRNTKTGKYRWVVDMSEASPEDAIRVKQDWLAGLSGGQPIWTTPTPEIFTDEQGNQWLKQTDQSGNVNWVFKGAAPTTGMTDWQKAQLGLEQQRIDWSKLQTAEELKAQRYGAEQQRFMAKDMGFQNQNRELQRQINEMQFERDRARLLSGTPSSDWITQWTLQNQPNPYRRREVSPIEQLETNLDTMTGTIQKYEAEAVLAANAESANRPYHITSGEANKIVSDLKERRTALENTWKTVQEESRDWSPQPVPQPYPNAPSWMPQYAPGLEAGQMITRQNVPTPSGQQLTAMSQAQLEQLGYFGKWTGQLGGKYPWEELTESAKLMQPRTPAGAGRFGWQPSRQF